jgi:L-alanine-DL-glutamate epimerase-like enolase superfamily enzyme
MNRRRFLRAVAGVTAAAPIAAVMLRAQRAIAAIPPMKITRIRYYYNPKGRPLFNQSANVVTIETDAGITGIGEGGAKDTVEQCAAMLIGEDPTRIDHLWQMMMRGYFYPAGREKLDALGALDLALWDIKGKALGVPIHQLLGGLARDHVECYSTGFPSKGSLKETARACVEAGFRAYRYSVADPPSDGAPFNSHQIVRTTAAHCREIREAVGPDADWAIDYHTRLDMPDAIRLSTLIENLEPYFCEDLIRSENPGVYRVLREQVKVPIAVGEQFGYKWDANELIENHLIDYARVTVPNVGGITEYMKICALCETHYVGLIPHFTGPISEAALVHTCGVVSGPVLMEMLGDGTRQNQPHLPECYDFRDGKMFPNNRPGLGVTLDTKPLELQAEITKRFRLTPIFQRPDGSITNW